MGIFQKAKNENPIFIRYISLIFLYPFYTQQDIKRFLGIKLNFKHP
ncbi:hypothetical protein CUP0068 [Campylobacter upsaliensis RM3195]|nr:hypothetical protein CUP0068 [Campylobacter upsaliensis RM3195]